MVTLVAEAAPCTSYVVHRRSNKLQKDQRDSDSVFWTEARWLRLSAREGRMGTGVRRVLLLLLLRRRGHVWAVVLADMRWRVARVRER